MTVVETISLALILSLNSFAVAANCSANNKITYSNGLFLSIFFAIFHAGFWLLGFFAGNLLKYDGNSFDAWIAFALITFTALKMILGALKKPKNANITFVTNLKSVILLSIASGIDLFIAGLGFGLLPCPESHHWLCCLLIAVLSLLITFFGVFAGRQGQRKQRKWISVIAGILLIVMIFTILSQIGIL